MLRTLLCSLGTVLASFLMTSPTHPSNQVTLYSGPKKVPKEGRHRQLQVPPPSMTMGCRCFSLSKPVGYAEWVHFFFLLRLFEMGRGGGVFHVAQAGLELAAILLSHLPQCWDTRHESCSALKEETEKAVVKVTGGVLLANRSEPGITPLGHGHI